MAKRRHKLRGRNARGPVQYKNVPLHVYADATDIFTEVLKSKGVEDPVLLKRRAYLAGQHLMRSKSFMQAAAEIYYEYGELIDEQSFDEDPEVMAQAILAAWKKSRK